MDRGAAPLDMLQQKLHPPPAISPVSWQMVVSRGTQYRAMGVPS